MSPPNWFELERLGGELIESFVAAALRMRYQDAVRVKPSQGDGGIDIYRDTDDGLVVWQIKRYASPLNGSQRSHVKGSWQRFWDQHVAAGDLIDRYYLATLWTPTRESQEWFRDEVTADANFPCQWDGESFFDGLASEFPGLYGMYFHGPDWLDKLFTAKTMLALGVGLPASTPMADLIRAQEAALREIRASTAANYRRDVSERAVPDGEVPSPPAGSVAIAYQYEQIGPNLFREEALVPVSAQSLEIEPVSFEFELDPQPGSAEALQVEAWLKWGVPLENMPSRSRAVGGPFHEEELSDGLISVIAVDADPAADPYPNLDLRVVLPDGTREILLPLNTTLVTHGVRGGTRIMATSRGGTVAVEYRHLPTSESSFESSLEMSTPLAGGAVPLTVWNELRLLQTLSEQTQFELGVEGMPTPLSAERSGFMFPREAELILSIAENLVSLQQVCASRVLMPDLRAITPSELQHLQMLARIWREGSTVATWGQMEKPVTQAVLDDHALFSQENKIVLVGQAAVKLGTDVWLLDRLLLREFASVRVADGQDRARLRPGDMLVLVPGTDPSCSVRFEPMTSEWAAARDAE